MVHIFFRPKLISTHFAAFTRKKNPHTDTIDTSTKKVALQIPYTLFFIRENTHTADDYACERFAKIAGKHCS